MGYYKRNYNYKKQDETQQQYEAKNLMTETEKKFYKIITKYFADDFIIQSQIPLSSIVKKNYNNYYANELNKTVDFGLIGKKTAKLYLLIEINDMTHNR